MTSYRVRREKRRCSSAGMIPARQLVVPAGSHRSSGRGDEGVGGTGNRKGRTTDIRSSATPICSCNRARSPALASSFTSAVNFRASAS